MQKNYSKTILVNKHSTKLQVSKSATKKCGDFDFKT